MIPIFNYDDPGTQEVSSAIAPCAGVASGSRPESRPSLPAATAAAKAEQKNPSPTSKSPKPKRTAKPTKQQQPQPSLHEQLAAQRRKAALASMMVLVDTGAQTTEQFTKLAAPLSSTELQQVAEERAISGACGNPLCSSPCTYKPERTVLRPTPTSIVEQPAPAQHFCSQRCQLIIQHYADKLGDPMLRLKPEAVAQQVASHRPRKGPAVAAQGGGVATMLADIKERDVSVVQQETAAAAEALEMMMQAQQQQDQQEQQQHAAAASVEGYQTRRSEPAAAAADVERPTSIEPVPAAKPAAQQQPSVKSILKKRSSVGHHKPAPAAPPLAPAEPVEQQQQQQRRVSFEPDIEYQPVQHKPQQPVLVFSAENLQSDPKQDIETKFGTLRLADSSELRQLTPSNEAAAAAAGGGDDGAAISSAAVAESSSTAAAGDSGGSSSGDAASADGIAVARAPGMLQFWFPPEAGGLGVSIKQQHQQQKSTHSTHQQRSSKATANATSSSHPPPSPAPPPSTPSCCSSSAAAAATPQPSKPRKFTPVQPPRRSTILLDTPPGVAVTSHSQHLQQPDKPTAHTTTTPTPPPPSPPPPAQEEEEDQPAFEEPSDDVSDLDSETMSYADDLSGSETDEEEDIELNGIKLAKGFFGRPPSGYRPELSPYGLVWSLLSSWAGWRAAAWLSGMHYEEGAAAMVPGVEVMQVRATMAELLGKALAALIAPLRIKVPQSDISRCLSTFTRQLRFDAPLPTLQQRQWQLITAAVLARLGDFHLPALAATFDAAGGRPELRELLRRWGFTAHQFDALVEVLVPEEELD